MSVPATLRGAYFWYIGNIRQALCTEPSSEKKLLAKKSKLATKRQQSKTCIVQARIITSWTFAVANRQLGGQRRFLSGEHIHKHSFGLTH